MKFMEYLQQERGRAAAVARTVGVVPAYLSQMAAGVRPVPPALVPALVKATDCQVPHWALRPTDWHRIWPELVGTSGAPDVPADQQQEVRDAA